MRRGLLRAMLALLLLWAAALVVALLVGGGRCCRGVAFTALRGFGYDIYTLDLDLRHTHRLTYDSEAGGGAFFAGWSPDGTQMALTADRDGRTGLYVMSATGRNPRRMPDDCLAQTAWSPDGRWLTCLPPPLNAGHFPTAYLIDVGAARAHPLTVRPGHGTRFVAWSPDGGSLLYDESSAAGAILVRLTLADGQRRPLAQMRGLHSLAWLTQESIGVVADCGGGPAIMVLAAEGAGRRCYPVPLLLPERVAWSPEGGRVAYTADCGAGPAPAWLTLADGRVTCAPGEQRLHTQFAWSPDGTRLAWGGHSDGLTRVQVQTIAVADEPPRTVWSARRYDGVAGLRWSPDGRFLSLAVIGGAGGLAGSFIVDVASGAAWRAPLETVLQPGLLAWQR